MQRFSYSDLCARRCRAGCANKRSLYRSITFVLAAFVQRQVIPPHCKMGLAKGQISLNDGSDLIRAQGPHLRLHQSI